MENWKNLLGSFFGELNWLSYGVRGNISSFLMDWEQTQTDLSKLLKEGDVWDWPMDRRRASQVVRVRIVKGQESIIDKF